MKGFIRHLSKKLGILNSRLALAEENAHRFQDLNYDHCNLPALCKIRIRVDSVCSKYLPCTVPYSGFILQSVLYNAIYWNVSQLSPNYNFPSFLFII